MPAPVNDPIAPEITMPLIDPLVVDRFPLVVVMTPDEVTDPLVDMFPTAVMVPLVVMWPTKNIPNC